METGPGARLDGRRSGRRTTRPTPRPAVVSEIPLGPAFVLLTHDDIAARAYGFYEARAGVGGDADADWHRAVSELRRRR